MYTVKKLAKISGVTPRTLRYYDEIGLLPPAATGDNGYRLYGEAEVEKLQQILFYRELGLELDKIGGILSDRGFNPMEALKSHHLALTQKRQRLDSLILTVEKSIARLKGEIEMTDKEKFSGFGQKLVDENEKKYGAEIRQKYGDDAVNASNAKVLKMTEEQYRQSENLLKSFEEALKEGFANGDPAGEAAQRACHLHKQWLQVFYPGYTKEYHMGLAEMYVCDDRFRANYDKFGAGCTEFLRDAIGIYCK